MMKVYENIRRLRENRGLSQSELGILVGYSRAAICRIEKGDMFVSQPKIVAFADALGVSPADLMGWSEKADEDQFSVDEKALVFRYRMLNSVGRKTAMSRIEELSLIPKYAKTSL